MKKKIAFTLIELLIVVAIIAILAAIAVPNFLEAQTRSKVSRAKADMRSVDVAMQAYVVDHNNEPQTMYYPVPDGRYSSWWGFTSHLLTTPVAYTTSLPAGPFMDKALLGMWKALDPRNSEQNQPFTTIRCTWHPAHWTPGVPNPDPAGKPSGFVGIPVEPSFVESARQSGYIIYCCGPDRMDSTVWSAPMTYDPTNGTVSFGDIYRFGPGSPDDNDLLH